MVDDDHGFHVQHEQHEQEIPNTRTATKSHSSGIGTSAHPLHPIPGAGDIRRHHCSRLREQRVYWQVAHVILQSMSYGNVVIAMSRPQRRRAIPWRILGVSLATFLARLSAISKETKLQLRRKLLKDQKAPKDTERPAGH
jgi:hypothetical protein